MTGQLFARGPYDGPDGKKVFILMGLVCPEDGELQGETQYTIAVPPVLVQPKNVKAHTVGNGLSGIIQSPIWRI